jgi:hypothetical protein
MSNDFYTDRTEKSEREKIPENISEEDVLYWAENIVTKRLPFFILITASMICLKRNEDKKY